MNKHDSKTAKVTVNYDIPSVSFTGLISVLDNIMAAPNSGSQKRGV